MNSKILNNAIRSPFFYVGDKYKLIPQIVPLFPQEINRFIEPFCGGGSVFLNTNAMEYCINDIDYYVIELHKYLISNSRSLDCFWSKTKENILEYNLSASFMDRVVPNALKNEYKKTYFAKYNKDAYIKMRDDFNQDKSRIDLLYLLLIYGFNRMLRFNANGNFNVPVGNVDFNSNVEKALNSYMRFVSDKKIELENRDFHEFIISVNPNKDDFVYMDPPYLITYSEYNKLWNEGNEKRLVSLLSDLDKRGVKFAISNVIYYRERENKIFRSWASNYNVHLINSNYISYHDNKEKQSYEVLVTNY